LFYRSVLSRRFGYSLGVDLIPFKVCVYNCIYCRLGRTTKKTAERKKYIDIGKEENVPDILQAAGILKG